MNKNMHPKFLKIKSEYDSFYNYLLSQGRIPMKETVKGFWGISTADDLFHLFSRLRLSNYKNFVDLGSGDGKPTLIASLFTKAIGIEIDDELIEHSERIKKKLKLDARFLMKDFLEHDLSNFDIVFINPDQHMTMLENKLLKELQGKLVVYGPHYHPKVLKEKDKFIAHTSPVAIYENI